MVALKTAVVWITRTAWPLARRAWPYISRNWLAALLAVALVSQQAIYQRQIRALRAELREARGVVREIVRVEPGETKTVYVKVPGEVIREKVPVVVTRTERSVEYRTQTVTLPPKEIERALLAAPAAIQADFVAARDIRAGERFTLTLAQVAPGAWQAFMPPDSPVQVTVTSRVQSAQVAPTSRWSFQVYAGYDSRAGPVTGVRASYGLGGAASVDVAGEYRWQTQDIGTRVTLGFSF